MVAAIIPIFVAALAIASFLNGFWMVGAFIFLPRSLTELCISFDVRADSCLLDFWVELCSVLVAILSVQ